MLRPILILQTLGDAAIFTPNNALLTLARHVDHRRYALVVAVPRPGALGEELSRSGASVAVVPGLRTYRRHDALWRLPAVTLRLVRLARRVRPGLIVANHAELAPFARAAARLSGVPWIGVLRQADRPPRYYRKYGVAKADALIAVSQAALDSLRAALPAGAALPPAVVIPTGIDAPGAGDGAPDRTLRGRLGYGPTDRVVGAVGLRGVKRPDILIDAMGRLLPAAPALKALFVGEIDAEVRRRLEERAGGLGLEGRIHFAGRQSDMPPYYQAMDVFAHPSESEALPKVVLEAMTHGLPVVAFRVGGIPEAVEDGVTGFVCPPGDLSAFADRLLRLVTRPDEAARFGAAGRRRLQGAFSGRAMTDRMMEMFDRVASAPGNGGRG